MNPKTKGKIIINVINSGETTVINCKTDVEMPALAPRGVIFIQQC